LYKSELHELLKNILDEYKGKLMSINVEELKGVLISNGIISENIKNDENIFYFPQLYKYWLSLKTRKYEYGNRLRVGKGAETYKFMNRPQSNMKQVKEIVRKYNK
jgi:hypothetical protein